MRFVSFASEPQVFLVEPILGSHSSSLDLFYSEEELLAIEKENSWIAKEFTTGKRSMIDEQEHSVRGLELEIPSIARRRYEIDDDAFEAVMAEQDNQDRRDVFNPDAIASAYQKHGAKLSQLQARNAGICDYEIAMDVYHQYANDENCGVRKGLPKVASINVSVVSSKVTKDNRKIKKFSAKAA